MVIRLVSAKCMGRFRNFSRHLIHKTRPPVGGKKFPVGEQSAFFGNGGVSHCALCSVLRAQRPLDAAFTFDHGITIDAGDVTGASVGEGLEDFENGLGRGPFREQAGAAPVMGNELEDAEVGESLSGSPADFLDEPNPTLAVDECAVFFSPSAGGQDEVGEPGARKRSEETAAGLSVVFPGKCGDASAAMNFPKLAVLIAGGRSRRMGRDKCLLEWRGKPLWEQQLGTLTVIGAERIVVVSPERPDWLPEGGQWMADVPGERVPLGDRGYEPVSAVYPAAAVVVAREWLDSGRRDLQGWVGELIKRDLVHGRKVEDPGLFRNLNCPEDLRECS